MGFRKYIYIVLLISLINFILSVPVVHASVTSDATVKVYSISYFPTDPANSLMLNFYRTGYKISISDLSSKVYTLNSSQIDRLNSSTNYKNNGSYLNYELYAEKVYLEDFRRGFEVPWKAGQGIYRPDYMFILNREGVCDLVDNVGIKEFWVWGYHYSDIEPAESNMSMGNIIRSYWNFPSYGDYSNSEMSNDLPVCNNTYVLYSFNYARSVAEALHNRGHHMEALLSRNDKNDLFWNKFIRPYGSTSGINSCGWTHFPPNGSKDYDYTNNTVVVSSCLDWKPEGIGSTTSFSCSLWECDHEKFMIWWFQRFPGENNGLIYQSRPLRNWWEYLGNYDKAVSRCGTLLDFDNTDLNCDTKTSIVDLIKFANILSTGEYSYKGDINDDGVLNNLDTTTLVNSFFGK